jgi:hypothetical protein
LYLAGVVELVESSTTAFAQAAAAAAAAGGGLRRNDRLLTIMAAMGGIALDLDEWPRIVND